MVFYTYLVMDIFLQKNVDFKAAASSVKNQTSCEVQYFHSGDLDYGGIKIFQYIRKTIFPELEPLQMDVETYEAYQEFTEVIDPETLEN